MAREFLEFLTLPQAQAVIAGRAMSTVPRNANR
jgi:hypothetical protein